MKDFVADNRPAFSWYAAWMIPSVVAVIGLATLEMWLPEPFPEHKEAQVQIIDFEHSALCQKFGLKPESEQYTACKVDLLELRYRDSRATIFL
jgi:hypothetical protein